MSSVLVVVGGLPASGKSTIAAALAKQSRTPYLRVDRIEQAIVTGSTLSHPLGPVGYAVAHELAAEQLALGLDVIVECVNPIALTRDGWVETGRASGAAVLEVELTCTDEVEHRRRVETRMTDVEGLTKPAWEAVLSREYEPWNRPHVILDTATRSAAEVVEQIVQHIDSLRAVGPDSGEESRGPRPAELRGLGAGPPGDRGTGPCPAAPRS